MIPSRSLSRAGTFHPHRDGPDDGYADDGRRGRAPEARHIDVLPPREESMRRRHGVPIETEQDAPEHHRVIPQLESDRPTPHSQTEVHMMPGSRLHSLSRPSSAGGDPATYESYNLKDDNIVGQPSHGRTPSIAEELDSGFGKKTSSQPGSVGGIGHPSRQPTVIPSDPEDIEREVGDRPKSRGSILVPPSPGRPISHGSRGEVSPRPPSPGRPISHGSRGEFSPHPASPGRPISHGSRGEFSPHPASPGRPISHGSRGEVSPHTTHASGDQDPHGKRRSSPDDDPNLGLRTPSVDDDFVLLPRDERLSEVFNRAEDERRIRYAEAEQHRDVLATQAEDHREDEFLAREAERQKIFEEGEKKRNETCEATRNEILKSPHEVVPDVQDHPHDHEASDGQHDPDIQGSVESQHDPASGIHDREDLHDAPGDPDDPVAKQDNLPTISIETVADGSVSRSSTSSSKSSIATKSICTIAETIRSQCALEREEFEAEKARILQSTEDETANLQAEFDDHFRALEAEVIALREENETQKLAKEQVDAERRDQETVELVERDEGLHSQVNEISTMLEEKNAQCQRLQELNDEELAKAEERRAKKDTDFEKLKDTLQHVIDEKEAAKLLAVEEKEREADRPGLEQLLEAIKKLGEEQSASLTSLMDGLRADSEKRHTETLTAVKAAGREKISFDVQRYLEHFSRTLAEEVRMLLGEVNKLRQHKRNAQQFGPGAEFDPDWDPPMPPLGHGWPPPGGPPSSGPDGPPEEPPVPAPKPGLRYVSPPHPPKLSKRQRRQKEAEAAAAAAQAGPSGPPDTRTIASWATWQPNPQWAPTPSQQEAELVASPSPPVCVSYLLTPLMLLPIKAILLGTICLPGIGTEPTKTKIEGSIGDLGHRIQQMLFVIREWPICEGISSIHRYAPPSNTGLLPYYEPPGRVSLFHLRRIQRCRCSIGDKFSMKRAKGFAAKSTATDIVHSFLSAASPDNPTVYIGRFLVRQNVFNSISQYKDTQGAE
ncbi:hypothetical protein BU17DRAFT_69100 [Hysterangium stoloniferum]|nr:hypothetical protein BU17DRAFT_69100 [Hysterangium stoloniferum]